MRQARWRGPEEHPTTGCRGEAWPAPGFDDPGSVEFKHYFFRPVPTLEGDPPGLAYACIADDLEFIEETEVTT